MDFERGLMKDFQADSKMWQEPSHVPGNLLQDSLSWSYRLCAEGDGKVYVLNTQRRFLRCLDVVSRQWTDTRHLDTLYRARWAAMTYNNGRLYVSGGRSIDRKLLYSTMFSITVARRGKPNVDIQVWKESDMFYGRTSHGMGTVGDRLLVCGGREDTGNRLANCEVFDLRTNTWTKIADMPIARSSFGLVSTATAVFVLGGIARYMPNDEFPTLTEEVSVLHRRTGEWTSLPTLPYRLSDIQAVHKGESLWVLAAVTRHKNSPDRASAVRHVLEYNISQQTWVTHQNTPAVGTVGMHAYAFPL